MKSSLKFCVIAAGEFDGYVAEPRACEWDIAAGHAILNHAGGKVTDFDNNEILYGKTDFKKNRLILKSKKKIHTKKINPCTKTFQALRIFVNKEITELIYGVVNATKNLKPGGKILVISFHSLEDRIIKYYFTNFSKNKSRPSRYLPESKIAENALFDEYKNKIFRPSKKEIEQNNRYRSAKLRFTFRSYNKFETPKDLIQKFKKYLDLEAINV